MTYNYDFLIAALFCLAVIFVNLLSRKDFIDYSNRVFSGYMLIGTIDILFDFLSSLLMEMEDPRFSVLAELVLVIFYLMQVLVIFMILFYSKSQEEKDHKQKRKELFLLSVPVICMALVIIVSPFFRLFFYFDADGTYHKGKLYLLMYIYALCYVLILVVETLRNKRYMSPKKRHIIWEMLAIMAICVVAQAVIPGLLLTGFGIGMGILLLATTLNNPRDYMDMLTGCYNNTYFNLICKELIERKKYFNVLSVGMKNIKQVNTVYGLPTGDSYLKFIAKELTDIAGSKHIYRINGSHFFIISQSDEEHSYIVNKVSKYFDTVHRFGDIDIPLNLEMCSICDAGSLKNADTIWSYFTYLYTSAGNDSNSTYLNSNLEQLTSFNKTKQIEKYLYEAVENDYFEIYIQLVYSPEKKRFISGETLSRLKHPDLGFIRPDIFIGMAENNGLISTISKMQFEKLCRFVSENPAIMDYLDNIKFNLSPADLLKKGLADNMLEMIEHYGLPYSFFQVEITETIAIQYSVDLKSVVKDFRDHGIGVCLDDFGSGYANLNTVLRLPFTCIKLDRSLLFGIGQDDKAEIFYRSIVHTLKSMKYLLVAEGVSTKEEMHIVTECGVDMIQGFYYSKPQPCMEVLQLLEDRQEESAANKY